MTSTLNVSGAGTYLHDVDVITSLTHTWSNDLNVTLTSPAGTTVTLTTANTSSGAGIANVYNGTLWDDDADPGNVVPYSTPFANSKLVTDTAYTSGAVETTLTPEEPLGAFIGENPNGDWTITIYDAFDFDGGALNQWTLDVTTLNASVVLTPVSTFNSTAPVAIPSSGVVSSTINVSGAQNYLQKLTLQTFITHTFSSDLDITLTSPAGTVVTLTTDNGAGNDNNYNGTVWDDDADPGNVVPYSAANSKLVTDTAYSDLVVKPLLTPEEPLAAFIGENPNGAWTITISDDAAGDVGNLASWKLNIQTPVDTIPPLVAVNQAVGQADPTKTSPINYTVVFNEPVTGFTASDVSFAGSTVGGTLQAAVSGSGTTYTVSVTGMTGEGTVVVTIPAGAAIDAAKNASKASTSTDNVVIYDTIGPGVTINQAVGQPDPVALGSTILFDVVFADPVTDFDDESDISFAGSTVSGALKASISGSGKTYTVSVTGMTGLGNVVATVVANAAADSLGNLSFASTSTDNTVKVDAVGQVEFEPAVYTATETGGKVTITATRTGGTANAVTVGYAPAGGTATAGLDYSNATGTLSWANGEVGPKSFDIILLDDTLVEGDETVNLVLSNPTNGLVLGTQTTAILTIEDLEEGLLQFTTTEIRVAEGDKAGESKFVTVSVERRDGVVGDVAVDWATSDDTARADLLDYKATSGTLSWKNGESGIKTFEIEILPDTANEGRENVLLTLSTPTNGSRIGLGEARISINPSDPKPAGPFTDSDGDKGTLSIVGGGTLGYYLTDPDGDTKGPVELIEVSGTNPLTSVLTLTATRMPTSTDGGRINLGAVTGTGLKILSAPRSHLDGGSHLDGDGIDLTGPLGTVVIGNVLNGADIKADGLPTDKTRILAKVVGDGTDIDLGSSLTVLSATKFGDGSISAPSIGLLAIRGNLLTAVPGSFGADVTVSGEGVLAGKPTVGTIRVAGEVLPGADLTVTKGFVNLVATGQFNGTLTAGGVTTMSVRGNLNGDLTMTGAGLPVGKVALGALTVSAQVHGESDISAPSIGSISILGLMSGDVTVSGAGVAAGKPALRALRVAGAVAGSDIFVNGNISLVQAASFRDSRLFAGYVGSDDGSGTFTTPATVTTFNLTDPNAGYDNSTAIATNFKLVTLASIDPDNGGDKFGFLADGTIGTLRVRAPQPFVYVPTDLSIQGVQDFEVRIV